MLAALLGLLLGAMTGSITALAAANVLGVSKHPTGGYKMIVWTLAGLPIGAIVGGGASFALIN